MLFPSASVQLAFAAGLGRAGLSPCAEPSAAMRPRVRHPTAKTANSFLILLPLRLCPNIEPDLPAQCNIDFAQLQKTDETRIRLPFLAPPLPKYKEGAKPKHCPRPSRITSSSIDDLR